MKLENNKVIFFATILLWDVFVLPGANISYANSADELKSKIADKGSQIKALEAQITSLDKSVKETAGTRQTLSTELKQIDAVKKKLETDIKITGKKIDLAKLNIEELSTQISDKGGRIQTGQSVVSDSIRAIAELESTSLPEKLLSRSNFSSIWNEISNYEDLQSKTLDHIKELEVLKKGLETDKNALEAEKVRTITLKNQLSDQQVIAAQNIKQKNQLITETKNKETNYKKLLADAEAKKAAVENELTQYESELRVIIDPNSLPSSGSKVLSWPLDPVFITQYFGLTEFSKTQPIYNGRGHNGIDLRASVGTALRSSGNGIVVGTGDTDPVCYGASYGKWIMIDHGNGLATIYGHLSLSKVIEGQHVNTGELIGYTGKTGYALGPHLHYSVVANQAVKVGYLKSKVMGCGTYRIPLGSFNGYLNPLLYL